MNAQYDDYLETDLLVVGGGINGCGIARDAAGRGLSVILCESNDIASGTSSWSTKLIHGGLRYLENYQFKLVRESLSEREVLMNMAPFLIQPLEFILPHEAHLRPRWLLQAGLFLYDHLSHHNTLPHSKKISLASYKPNNALRPQLTTGFSYYDCQTNDARLTLLNALDAKEKGATILTYTQCTDIQKNNGFWMASLKTKNKKLMVRAHAIINATGPWADNFNRDIAHTHTTPKLKLVQGSHIIVPKLYDGTHAYILQNKDKRIVFAIPYLNQFTLIGTTDTAFSGDPSTAQLTPAECNYLCSVVNHYFKQPISASSIRSSYSGVRALYDNHTNNLSTTSRDYHIQYDTDTPGYITVYGGKLTTYRKLAEATLKKLASQFPQMQPCWTANSKLPGANLNGLTIKDYTASLSNQFPWMPFTQMQRYTHTYGSRTIELLAGVNSQHDLGQHYGADLYQQEVNYWKAHELAITPEDMLTRRSQFMLMLSAVETKAFKEALAHNP